jgi:HD-GYP domain-containing protein (c-di-GMP phosphodiesterase class II)
VPLRCLSLADIYDALTSDRAYRRALPRQQALKIMREEASMGMWDSSLIDKFSDMLERENI